MDAPTTIPADPVAILRQLDPDQIRERLATMERERQALLVLLRAASRNKPDRKGAPSGN
jgi:hypothetical protein